MSIKLILTASRDICTYYCKTSKLIIALLKSKLFIGTNIYSMYIHMLKNKNNENEKILVVLPIINK